MQSVEAVSKLKTKLPNAVVEVSDFMNQISLEIKKENLIEVLSFFKEAIKPGYEVLMDLSAVDFLEPTNRTKIFYHLHNPTNYERIRIFFYIERNEKIPSVTHLWEGADWYERELYDMFGVHFENRPNMQRILMPDDWVGHPMQRDYPLTEEPVEFKYGVKPKVPSEIIKIRSRQKLIR